jgi:hypothetical protein
VYDYDSVFKVQDGEYMVTSEVLGGVGFIVVAAALVVFRRPVSKFMAAWNGLLLPKALAQSTPSGVVLLAAVPFLIGVLYLLHAFMA